MVTWHLTMKLFPAQCQEQASRPYFPQREKEMMMMMPWAGNIVKTMTSNRKQFTVTRKMLIAVARHLSTMWSFVFHRFDPFVLLYNKSLNDWSLGKQRLNFVSLKPPCFPQLCLGKHWDSQCRNKIHCSPWDQSLSGTEVKWHWSKSTEV